MLAKVVTMTNSCWPQGVPVWPEEDVPCDPALRGSVHRGSAEGEDNSRARYVVKNLSQISRHVSNTLDMSQSLCAIGLTKSSVRKRLMLPRVLAIY